MEMITVAVAAKRLGVSQVTTRRWTSRGWPRLLSGQRAAGAQLLVSSITRNDDTATGRGSIWPTTPRLSLSGCDPKLPEHC